MIFIRNGQTIHFPSELLERWSKTNPEFRKKEDRIDAAMKTITGSRDFQMAETEDAARAVIKTKGAFDIMADYYDSVISDFFATLGDDRIVQEDYVMDATREDVEQELLHRDPDSLGFDIDQCEPLICQVCKRAHEEQQEMIRAANQPPPMIQYDPHAPMVFLRDS